MVVYILFITLYTYIVWSHGHCLATFREIWLAILTVVSRLIFIFFPFLNMSAQNFKTLRYNLFSDNQSLATNHEIVELILSKCVSWIQCHIILENCISTAHIYAIHESHSGRKTKHNMRIWTEFILACYFWHATWNIFTHIITWHWIILLFDISL